MKRNMEKAVAQGAAITQRRPALDLTVPEIHCLYETFRRTGAEEGLSNALFNLITQVYHMGLAVGMRNAK